MNTKHVDITYSDNTFHHQYLHAFPNIDFLHFLSTTYSSFDRTLSRRSLSYVSLYITGNYTDHEIFSLHNLQFDYCRLCKCPFIQYRFKKISSFLKITILDSGQDYH